MLDRMASSNPNLDSTYNAAWPGRHQLRVIHAQSLEVVRGVAFLGCHTVLAAPLLGMPWLFWWIIAAVPNAAAFGDDWPLRQDRERVRVLERHDDERCRGALHQCYILGALQGSCHLLASGQHSTHGAMLTTEVVRMDRQRLFAAHLFVRIRNRL